MKILVACEESQAVCRAFREKGHEAYSCDIMDCSGGRPDWHIKADVIPLLDGSCSFETADGTMHSVDGRWDMLIAFPPCTYLSNAGAARLYKRVNNKSYCDVERLNKGLDAKEFFMRFFNAKCERIAVENPIPSGVFRLPPYTQVIQPYEYGHPYSKKTCLWLRGGLEKLKPTDIVKPICSWVSGGSKDKHGNKRKNCGTTIRDPEERAKTFIGVAAAMAEQWG